MTHLELIQPNIFLEFDQFDRPVFLAWVVRCNECQAHKAEGQSFDPWWTWHKETCRYYYG